MVRSRTLLILALSLAWLGMGVAQSEARSDRVKGARPFESSAETVDLFQAVERGELSVKVIPQDSKQCRVFITNQTDRKLNVQMPAALAAVPVLAQQQLPNAFDPGQNNSTAPQRLGVGNPFGQQNPLQMGPNMQGPLMNPGNQPFFAPFCIAPEKVAQLRLPTVCLDHGHPDPRPAMTYRLEPLTVVSESKELELLCRQLGQQPNSQRVAQAAAWHFTNRKTWEELQSLTVRRLARPDQPFFTSHEIKQAKSLVETLELKAASSKTRPRPSLASAP